VLILLEGKIALAMQESNVAYSYTFLRSVVCMSVFCHIRVFDGFACHMAGAFAGSNNTLC